MIVNDLSKVQDIECYSYCDDGEGNIEIMFRISDEEQSVSKNYFKNVLNILRKNGGVK